mmetsp:Transcript_14465/g.24111  ORF Transcript_14465/g.24111 Transcript_14465/m.24111 type:complete len:288 (-) Transcript_14465:549-1412(-)
MRAPSSTTLSRLAFRSIEFSSTLPFADLASVPSPPTHFILPHLPSIVTSETKADFRLRTVPRIDVDNSVSRDSVTSFHKPRPIMTIAASLFEDSASLVGAARERIEAYGADTLLIVGGNERTEKSFTSPEAINILSESFPTDTVSLFCAWDPNSPRDLDHLAKKIDAGATGVITQPLLTNSAWNQLDMCQSEAVFGEQIMLIPGMALPKSKKNLMFWSSLLKELSDTIQKDDEFVQSLRYFESPDFSESNRCAWSMEQRDRLLSYEITQGIHFMPLGNKADLLQILR